MTAQPHHIFLIRGELTEQGEKHGRNEKEKIKTKETKRMTETDSVQSVHELLLLSLYGVGWSHIVTGDVTFLSGVDGASLPPVTFPGEKSQLEIRNTRYKNKREEWTLKRRL